MQNNSSISKEIKNEIAHRVEAFNTQYLSSKPSKYVPNIQKNFIYLNRINANGQEEQVCRLKYTSDLSNMSFAIFKYSSEKYDEKEFFFPGSELVDGTLEGAMKAGLEAYPIESSLVLNTSSNECACCKGLGILDIIQQLFEMDRQADIKKAKKSQAVKKTNKSPKTSMDIV